MATNTYVALDKVTVGTATPSITFSSIPQGYTDLVVVANTKNSVVTVNGLFIRYNGDTASNYSNTFLYGNGTSALSSRASSQTQAHVGWDGSTDFVPTIINIQNYSNATTYKTALSRSNEPSSRVAAWVSLWRSTSAITSITLTAESPANFAVGSTFSLYGITAQPVAVAKATGGTIVYAADGYTYHSFTSGSSSFVPSQALSCDVLMVAGGGGGMYGKSAIYAGSGGGAGQVSGYTATAFASGVTHTVAIGGGGAGAGGVDVNGTTGTSSTISGSGFTTLTATGGGGGLFNTGSGGTSGNGFAGGSAAGGDSSGGGGGGATAVGGIWSLGNGGAGTSAFSQYGLATNTGDKVSGIVYYGSGGNGQGGSLQTTKVPGGGGYRNSNKNGVANTGGGGAGGNDGTGSGGSGLVIIRYVSA
jgi:hypothetical protein